LRSLTPGGRGATEKESNLVAKERASIAIKSTYGDLERWYTEDRVEEEDDTGRQDINLSGV